MSKPKEGECPFCGEAGEAEIEHGDNCVRMVCACGASGSWQYHIDAYHKDAMDYVNAEWDLVFDAPRAEAYRSGLEEAARICEERIQTLRDLAKRSSSADQDLMVQWIEEARICAAAIRSKLEEG